MVKELFKDPVQEVVLTLLMILARCQSPDEFSLSGTKLLESIERNYKAIFPVVRQICQVVYGCNFDDNAPAAMAELIIGSFSSSHLKKVIPGTGSVKSAGPAKIENSQGKVLDTSETGTGNRNFDLVWYKTVNQHGRDIIGGWGVEVKLNVANYINEKSFERKLRYMQCVSDTVANWTSKVVTVRTIGSTTDFATYAASVYASRVELVSVWDLYHTVYP